MGAMRKDWKRRCNARTRKGTLCGRRELFKSGRCRNRGGLSAGPKKEGGKRRVWEGRQRWRAEQRRLKALAEME